MVEVGPHHRLYVTTLPGGPEDPSFGARGSVYKLSDRVYHPYRIATGFAESAVAVAQAVHEIRPETKIQPKYSTNTGVPGAVEGQP